MPFQRAERSNGTQAVHVRADLFPARISINGSIAHDPVKAIIGVDTLWLYSVTGNDGTLVGEFSVDDLSRNRSNGYIVKSGTNTILIDRSGNCGCGGNRSWKPFPYILSMVAIKRV